MEALLELWTDENVQNNLNSIVHNKDIYHNNKPIDAGWVFALIHCASVNRTVKLG